MSAHDLISMLLEGKGVLLIFFFFFSVGGNLIPKSPEYWLEISL